MGTQKKTTTKKSKTVDALSMIEAPKVVKVKQRFQLTGLVAIDPSDNIGRAAFGADFKRKTMAIESNAPILSEPLFSGDAVLLRENKNKVTMKPFCDMVRAILKAEDKAEEWQIAQRTDDDESPITYHKMVDDDLLTFLKRIENTVPQWIVFDGFHRVFHHNLRECHRGILSDIPLQSSNFPAEVHNATDEEAHEICARANAHNQRTRRSMDRDWFKLFINDCRANPKPQSDAKRYHRLGLDGLINNRLRSVFGALRKYLARHPEDFDVILTERLWTGFQASGGMTDKVAAAKNLKALRRLLAGKKAKGEKEKTIHRHTLRTILTENPCNPFAGALLIAVIESDVDTLIELMATRALDSFNKKNKGNVDAWLNPTDDSDADDSE